MLILSQDSDVLVDINNCKRIYVDCMPESEPNIWRIMAATDDGYRDIALGYYESSATAHITLAKIGEVYSNGYRLVTIPQEGETL